MESDVDEGGGGFGCQPTSPILAGQVKGERCFGPRRIFASGKPTTADELFFGLEYGSPEAERFRGGAEILRAEALASFFYRPADALAADIVANLRVAVHVDEILLVARLVRAEQQARRFEEDHDENRFELCCDG
jgi:hypothetical protein